MIHSQRKHCSIGLFVLLIYAKAQTTQSGQPGQTITICVYFCIFFTCIFLSCNIYKHNFLQNCAAQQMNIADSNASQFAEAMSTVSSVQPVKTDSTKCPITSVITTRMICKPSTICFAYGRTLRENVLCQSSDTKYWCSDSLLSSNNIYLWSTSSQNGSWKVCEVNSIYDWNCTQEHHSIKAACLQYQQQKLS